MTVSDGPNLTQEGEGNGHRPGAVGAIPLPDAPDGERTRRRRAQQRARRRRRRRRLLVILGVIVVVSAASVLATRPRSQDSARPPSPRPAQPPTAAVPPLMVAHVDGAGRASSLTVLAPGPSGEGGTLLLIPPGTMTEVVSLGLEPVGQSLELGGVTRLQGTVENLLGASLREVVVVDDGALTRLLAPLGALVVATPERVEQVAPSGVVTVLYEPGPTRLVPSEAGRYLAARGRANDLSRMARHQAFWEAWLAALRQRPEAAPQHPRSLAEGLRALWEGRVSTRVLPVEAVGPGAQGSELYRVKADELTRLVAEALPGAARRGPAERPRVQVLNGTGAVGLADAVRGRLGAGFDVRLTGNAATFDHERTEVIYYDHGEQAVAERVRQALGVGTLVLSRRPLDVVDITVIVGKDFRPD